MLLRFHKAGCWAGLLALSIAAGCGPREDVPTAYVPSNAHEAYSLSLRQAGLADSALGRGWLEASTASLEHSLAVELPLEETFHVDRTRAFAIAYRFFVRRGHRAEIELRVDNGDLSRLFLDVFHADGPADQWRQVASAPAGDLRLAFEPRQDGDYALRVQPELLGGGNITLTIRSVAILSFPVQDRSERDIGSRFGAPREGGRRSHHGVDIFAPRHTPVLAPTAGRARRVGTNRLGGNIVWLYDESRALHFYFAHLETQTVESGTLVQAGDQIGTVGNSGNARTTPTHLHFGIYGRGEGPLNPDSFLLHPPAVLDALLVDTRLVGRVGRTLAATHLATIGAPPIALAPGTPMHLLAARGSAFRVALPGGETGYVPGTAVESAEAALERERLTRGRYLLPFPRNGDSPVAWIEPGSRLETIGYLSGYRLVRTSSGLTGWSPLPRSEQLAD